MLHDSNRMNSLKFGQLQMEMPILAANLLFLHENQWYIQFSCSVSFCDLWVSACVFIISFNPDVHIIRIDWNYQLIQFYNQIRSSWVRYTVSAHRNSPFYCSFSFTFILFATLLFQVVIYFILSLLFLSRALFIVISFVFGLGSSIQQQ